MINVCDWAPRHVNLHICPCVSMCTNRYHNGQINFKVYSLGKEIKMETFTNKAQGSKITGIQLLQE